jgi:hypothetical protein
MSNTKAIGVAYADPLFESVSVAGNVTADTMTATNGITAGVSSIAGVSSSSFTATGANAVSNAVAGLYFFDTAITANSTVTTAPAGSIATTSNATGLGKLFVSDGSKWQFAVVA